MSLLRSLALVVGLFAVTVSEADAAITLQQAACGTASTGDPVTVTCGSNWTAGSLIVVGLAINSQTITVTSVTTGAGCGSEAGVQAKRQVNTTNSITAEIWYIANTAGGCNTVVIDYSASVNQFPRVMEFAGAATSSPLDQTDGQNITVTGTSHPASATTMTPSVDNTVVVSMSRTDGTGTSGTAATNFTESGDTTIGYAQYWIQTTATATDAAWTSAANARSANAMASFKEPSAASNAKRLLLLGVGDQ